MHRRRRRRRRRRGLGRFLPPGREKKKDHPVSKFSVSRIRAGRNRVTPVLARADESQERTKMRRPE